jgi:hypothetical protein
MLGARRKSSITQSSLLLPWLSAGDLSGPRSSFTLAHASHPGARNCMKKIIWARNARLTQRKKAAIARS